MGNAQEIYCNFCGEPDYDSSMQSEEHNQILTMAESPHIKPSSKPHQPTHHSSITKHQPTLMKSEYNKTSVSLYARQIINKKDPNYKLLPSFKRNASSYGYNNVVKESRSPSGTNRSKDTPTLFKILSTNVSFNDEADALWRATTEEKQKLKDSQKQFDWNTDGIMELDFEIINMHKPPLLNIYMNDIIYYKCFETGNDYVIGCTAYMHIMKSELEDGIYRYNINTSEYEYLGEIPDELCDYQVNLAFDHQNECLHLLFGDGNIWAKFYVKQKVWDIISSPEDYPNQYGITRLRNAQCLIVHQVAHVIGNGQHLIYDTPSQYFIEYKLTTRGEFEPKNFIHVPVLNRLYIFGGHGNSEPDYSTYSAKSMNRMEITNDVWYVDLSDEHNEWQRHPLRLPYRMNKLDYHTVICYEYLVFIFYHTSHEVWCLDLKHDYLVKADHLCEIELGQYSQMIATKDNIIHSICLDSFGPVHVKIDAEQLIPDEIFELYSKPCADLICGYIKETCKYNIPFKIKQHIFGYYPVFL